MHISEVLNMVAGRKVQWHPKNRSITQIPKEGLEFAWVSENHQQIHQLVWCKDFMQDMVFGSFNNKDVSIYGLEWNSETSVPVFLKKTRIMIANRKDHDFGQKVLNNLKEFLHGIESKLKMEKTTFEKCTYVPGVYSKAGVYLLNSDARWMIAPPMVSLFALLLRVGMTHILGQTFGTTLRGVRDGKIPMYYPPDVFHSSQTDKTVLKNCYKTIQKIIKHGDQAIFGTDMAKNYPAKMSIFCIHDRCGLTAFTQGSMQFDFPHWFKIQ